ncbi:MAG: alpha/beta hydrolase [Chitinophagaceae bacterium]
MKKSWRRIGWSSLILFLLINAVCFMHAWKFTHFADAGIERPSAYTLSAFDKIKALALGVNQPRPLNKSVPNVPFEPVRIRSNKEIAGWYMPVDSGRGTIILFHGYGGEKSGMLDKAALFAEMGYNTLVIDFMGSGESAGNQTTIGYKEGKQVQSTYEYVWQRGEKNIYLFGTSMGAAAILKCMNDTTLHPKGIILECPFGSLYQTTSARFRKMGIPAFPMAGLLVFWGGVQNGFWGFGHQPQRYAKAVESPTLLLYGEKDDRVSRAETDNIFAALKGSKQLVTFPEAGHENYLTRYRAEWTKTIHDFLEKNP